MAQWSDQVDRALHADPAVQPNTESDLDFQDSTTQIYQRPVAVAAPLPYRVAFSAEDVRRTTLEPLRQAYLSGELPDDVFVLRPGATEWCRPSELFGGKSSTNQRAVSAPVVARLSPPPVASRPTTPQVSPPRAVVPVRARPAAGVRPMSPLHAAAPGAPRAVVSRPPATVSRPPATVSRPPATVSRPPATVSRPPATVSRPPATVSRPPATVSRPPATVSTPPATVSTPPATVRPVARTAPPVAQRQASRWPLALLAVAVLAASIVTLQRRGVLRQWAKAQGLELAYERIETRLLGGSVSDQGHNSAAVAAPDAPILAQQEAEPPEAPSAAPEASAADLGTAPASSVLEVTEEQLPPSAEEETTPVPPVKAMPAVRRRSISKDARPASPRSSPSSDETLAVQQQKSTDIDPEPTTPAADPEGEPAAGTEPAAAAEPAEAAPKAEEWKRNGVVPASRADLTSAMRGVVDNAKKKKRKKKQTSADFDPLNPSLD